MTLRELKNSILDNRLPDGLIIMVCGGNRFLADQYIGKLCALRHCEPTYIRALSDLTTSALTLVFDYESGVNVLRTEVFSEFLPDYSIVKNCFVVCDKVDPKIKDAVKSFMVEVKPPVDWQIKAYIKTECPGVDDQFTEWLYSAAKGDIDRIANEVDKIKLFGKSEQLKIGEQLKFENQTDLYSLSIFELSNAIISNDRRKVLEYMWHSDVCEVEPLAIVNLLLGNFKKSLLINYNGGLTATEMGMSSAQFNYLARHATLSKAFLTKAVDFLSNIDYRIKSGGLDVPKQTAVDYIICRTLSLHRQS